MSRSKVASLVRLVVLLVAAFALQTAAEAQSLGLGTDPRLAGGPARNTDAAATLVVYNELDPDSKELARFYVEKRGIPREQMLGLRCPTTEEISRAEFDATIAEPLRRAFTSNFWWKLREPDSPLGPVEWNHIRFVALIRGMPLKIAPAQNYPGDKPSGPPPVSEHNEASVDSELAVLGLPHTISGAVNNPYYRSFSRFADTSRPECLLVCRLDAPTVATVRRMITDSLAAEKNGLEGMVYVDARGLAGGSGGLKEGDDWLMAAANTARRHGFPVILDNGDGLFPDAYPMRHAAFYFGWYAEHVNGTFLQKGAKFVPGAIACHIHSFSAITLRDPRKQWAGPLLEAGAAATLGNVYEPYLTLTPRLDTFFERLVSGFTFAESAYMSQKALSWMTTFIGDPLYRPFPVQDGREESGGAGEWDAYRAGAKLWYGQDHAAGEAALQASGRKLKSGAVFEGLALLELAAEAKPAALAAFQEARKYYKNADDQLRVSIHEVILLRGMNREDDALALARKQIAAYPQAAAIAIFPMLLPELAPKPATPPAKTP